MITLLFRSLLPRPRTLALVALLGLPGLPFDARAATCTWTGGGTNGNWSTAANWQGGVPVSNQNTALIFGGSAQLASNQNVGSAFSLNSLAFGSDAGAFVLGGGRLDFFTSSASVLPTITQNSAALVTINNDLRINNAMTVGGTGNLTLGGTIENTVGLTKAGTGTLTLTGTNAYTAATNVNAGTLAVSTGGSLSGSDITVADGATLAINGSGTVAMGSANALNLNGTSTSAARLTLAGTGSFSTGAATLSIGTTGLAEIVQNGGAFTSSGSSFRLGAGSTGSYLMNAGTFGANFAYVGYFSTGSFTQMGGAVTVNNQLIVGTNAGSEGTYVLGGTGTLSASSLIVGATGQGSFTQNGGSNTVANTLYVSFRASGLTDTYTLGGGTLTTNRTQVGLLAHGEFTQTGGAHTTGTLGLSGGSFLSTGVYSLLGGTLTAGSVVNHDTSSPVPGVTTFNFGGGILRASGSTTSFLQDLTAANVQLGGAKIDTDAFNITIAQPLRHDPSLLAAADGGLTKFGVGTLTLTGTNTFTGSVNINAGILAVGSEANLGTGSVTVGSGGALRFTANSATLTHTYNLGVSTLAAASGQTLTFAGATINGGYLAGPGANLLSNGTILNNTRAGTGTVLTQIGGTVSFNDVTLSGNSAFSQAAGATLNTTGDFITTLQTTLTVNGTANLAGGSVSGALTVNSGGIVSANGGSAAPLYLDGSRGTTINAGGQLNAASGSTIELGGLLVNNGTQTGVLNVNLGGMVRGTGQYGTVTVNNGATFGVNAPATGNGAIGGLAVIHLAAANGLVETAFVGPQFMAAPGSANVTSLTLGSGSVFAFNVRDAQGAAGSGYDTVHANSTLTLAAGTTAGNLITVSLTSLGSDGTAGLTANFDPTKNYTFVLVQADGGITGYAVGQFAVDASGFQNATNGGSFSVVPQGNNLDLVFTAAVVPEPGTWTLVGLGVGSLMCAVRRRSRQVAA